MNKIFTRSVLVLALFSPWVNASVNSAGENCNADEGLDGWAIWCGVDTYLAQQEPTAAGVIGGAAEGIVVSNVVSSVEDTGVFSGALEVPEETLPVTPPVIPVTPPEPEIEYNWQGYAMLTHPDFGGLQSGELKLRVDTTTGEVIGVLTTALGEEITFNEGAGFYVSPELLPLIDSPLPDLSNEAGIEQISQFEVASEGSLLKLVTFPQDWLFSAVGTSYDPEHTSVSTIGQINDGTSVVGSFVAGSLTPLDRMAEFATLNRVAEYAGYGMYSGVGRVDNAVRVDFGQATWFGTWYGDLNIGAAGTVSGNQFSSNTMNGFGVDSQASVSGTIQGAFNGDNASTLTGLLDVVKDGQAIVGTFKNVIYSDSITPSDLSQ